jgi:hypothetical protein
MNFLCFWPKEWLGIWSLMLAFRCWNNRRGFKASKLQLNRIHQTKKALNILIKYFHPHHSLVKPSSRAKRSRYHLQSVEKGRRNLSRCRAKSTDHGDSDGECAGTGISRQNATSTHEICGTNAATETGTDGAKCYRHVEFRSENAAQTVSFTFFPC